MDGSHRSTLLGEEDYYMRCASGRESIYIVDGVVIIEVVADYSTNKDGFTIKSKSLQK